MKKNSTFCSILLASLLVGCQQTQDTYRPNITTVVSPKGTDVFQADSVSIAQHYQIPDWFRDAKFGIFIHWGPASVPAYDGWYARFMYDKDSHVHKYHVEHYGPVTEFGYKDFIPMFKAEKFNAAEWAKLFKESGAKYVIPVAEHHDGFALYRSTFNRYNSVEMGPKRDLMQELKEAILAENLHFGMSSHRAENCWFFNKGMEIPSDVHNPEYTLYGERIAGPDGESLSEEVIQHDGSNEHSRKNWLTHMYELIDLYQPELLYFDWTVGKKPFQETFYKFMAYYYNNALDWKKGVVVNTKFGYGDHIQVFDIERGKSDKAREYPWQTDTSIGKVFWFYQKDESDLKSPDHIIDDLVDIVSKNGNLLLNVGPRADGTIPEKQQEVLHEIGNWLKVNGEAIYGTRPWLIAQEGPTQGTSGSMTDSKNTNYTPEDIRFTSKGENVYAIVLERPKGQVVIKSLAQGNERKQKISHVSILGYDQDITWKQTTEGLVLDFPKDIATKYAYTIKIN